MNTDDSASVFILLPSEEKGNRNYLIPVRSIRYVCSSETVYGGEACYVYWDRDHKITVPMSVQEVHQMIKDAIKGKEQ